MKFLICIFVIVALRNAVFADKYTSRFDQINVEEILKSDRLFKSYVDCLLDKGKCTPEGEELKSHVKEALEEGCEKCSDGHKEGIKKVIGFLVKNKESDWNELVQKYDPEGAYRSKYADLLKSVV